MLSSVLNIFSVNGKEIIFFFVNSVECRFLKELHKKYTHVYVYFIKMTFNMKITVLFEKKKKSVEISD